MEGGLCRLFTAAALLLSFGFIAANEDSLGKSLDSADQRLDAMTQRMVSLAKQLDSVVADRNRAELKSKLFAQRLDIHEGNPRLKYQVFSCGTLRMGICDNLF